MKKFKKISVLVLCLVMVFAFFGCKKEEPEHTSNSNIVKDGGIDDIGYTLPYLRSDSLNPFKATEEVNKSISTLLYDSLFAVDNSFKAVPLVAESFKADGTKLNVKLKAVKFSDGSALTSNDVVYSFNAAKKSDNYSTYLANISGAFADGDNSVTFSLSRKNPYEAANLFFPIIKKGSDTDEKSSDDYSKSIPVGSGRYTITQQGDSKVLVYNKDRLGGYQPVYLKVGLKDVAEISSMPNMLTLGQIDYYNDNLTRGKFDRYSGTAAKKNMSNFVFLGVNDDETILSDSRVRRAIALLLEREDLAEISYAGFAEATSTPFPAGFYGLKGCTLPTLKTDKEAAVELLKQAGYNQVSNTGVRYGENGSLRLRLVVNFENNFRLAMARSIQQSLAKADIIVDISEMSYDSYISTIGNGGYELYVGEAVLSNSFDLSRFFDKGGRLSFGISEKSKSIAKYNKLESGEIGMQEFLDTFSDELPFIPIAYRKSLAVHSNVIKTQTEMISSDYFYNIDKWTTK